MGQRTVNRAADTACRLVARERQIAVGSELVEQLFQREGEQRQSVRAGRIHDELAHQRRLHLQPTHPLGVDLRRLDDHVAIGGGRQRRQVEHLRLVEAKRRPALQQSLNAVCADGDEHVGVEIAGRRSEHRRDGFEEAPALGGVLGREQLLALIDANKRSWGSRVGSASAPGGGSQSDGLADQVGEILGRRLRVGLPDGGVDVARQFRLAVAREPWCELATDAVWTRQYALRGPHDGQRCKVGVAFEPGPQPGAQERRLASPRCRLDHDQPWRTALAHQAQLGDAIHDVGFAAKEDTRVVFVEGS